MPHHDRALICGRITDVFAHRFLIEAEDGRRILADLGPEGVALFRLEPGLVVRVEGERKPSELKVDRIAAEGEAPVAIPHKAKPRHGPNARGPHGHAAAPEVAVEAVRAAGYQPLGAPRRKPKHYELLARRGAEFVECHVTLDGHIRKEKPVAPHDGKWSDAIGAAA